MPASTADGITKQRALLILGVITLIGAAFRFYNLAWAAPFSADFA